MFKQLRRKLLIVNMSIITVVMAVAFIAVYVTTYSGIRNENKSKLDSGGIITNQVGENIISGAEGQMTVRHSLVDNRRAFSVEVDKQGNALSVLSDLELTEEECIWAAGQAWAEYENYSILTFAGRDWMYVIKEAGSTQTIIEDGKQTFINQVDGLRIDFLDVTDSNKTLFSLLMTFIGVGFVMLFVIAGISLYFANRSIRPLREAWDKQKRFVADASHELKTPLAIINANADAIMVNAQQPVASQEKWLNYIKEETGRMSKLVNDMLYLAKTEDMEFDEVAADIDLSALVSELCLSVEAFVYEAGLHLTEDIQQGIHYHGHSENLRRVLLSLFDNAGKYTDPGGSIHVALGQNRHWIEFSITNNFEKLQEEQLLHLFDRFYREDNARNSSGSGFGLGLSVAKAMIEKEGGKLEAKSLEKGKITFCIRLASCGKNSQTAEVAR